MDPERYRNSTAGRLVRAGLGDAAYWAFCAASLAAGLAAGPGGGAASPAADGALQASAARRPRPGSLHPM